MVTKALRAVQVGVGGIGRGHLTSLTANERFDLVAVCDAYPRRPDVRASLAHTKALGIPFFKDYRQAFRAVEADVAFICTPHHWHAPMTIAALERGLHVFVEKPAASSVSDAGRMLQAQRNARKVVAVGFNPLATSACIALKRSIARGELGRIREVVAVITWYRADAYYRRAKWAGRARVDGRWCRDGVMYNQGSHTIAAALMLANTSPAPTLSVARRASAALYRAHPVRTLEMEDLVCAVAELEGRSPTRLHFYATTCSQDRQDRTWIRVFGEKGAATLGLHHLDLYDASTRAISPASVLSKHDNFYEAIVRGAIPYAPLEQAVKVTYTIDAIYRAARGRIQKVRWADLGDTSEIIARAAAQRCRFSEMDTAPPWAAPSR